MVHDGTEDGVLGLLEGQPEGCWRLDVGGATEVFDVVPHGWLVVYWGCCGGLVRACNEK